MFVWIEVGKKRPQQGFELCVLGVLLRPLSCHLYPVTLSCHSILSLYPVTLSWVQFFYSPPHPTLTAPIHKSTISPYLLDSHLTVPPPCLPSLPIHWVHTLPWLLRFPSLPISTSTRSMSTRLTLFSCCSVKWSVGEVHAEWRERDMLHILVSGELEWRRSRWVWLCISDCLENGVTSD